MSVLDFVGFVDDLATASGSAILPFFRSSLAAADKSRGGVFDPVTEADKAAESVMRQMILRAFPSHGIIAEEFGDERADAEYTWVLDPIDGTKSFISGLPTWGTLIALQHRGLPVYGLMNQPFTRERFSGDGHSAQWRGHDGAGAPVSRALRTRACDGLGVATLMTTSPQMFDEPGLDAFRRVERSVRLSRYGGDCYAYCALAAGHVDLVIESGLKPYDIAALVPVIEGAGGVITNWAGGGAASGGSIVAAGDKRMHAAAVKLLNGG